jgi:hypothetical protein
VPTATLGATIGPDLLIRVPHVDAAHGTVRSLHEHTAAIARDVRPAVACQHFGPGKSRVSNIEAGERRRLTTARARKKITYSVPYS